MKTLLTLADISRQFGIPRSTLKKYAWEGKLPVVRVGRRLYVDVEQFRKELRRGRIGKPVFDVGAGFKPARAVKKTG